jgi:hypothetical protein
VGETRWDVGEHTPEKVRELNEELFTLARVLIRAEGKPRIAAVTGICSGAQTRNG